MNGDEQPKFFLQRRPIDRLKQYMVSKELWDESYGLKTVAQAREQVEAAVKELEAIAPPQPQDIFRYTYREMTRELNEQMEGFLSGNGRGK